LIVLALTIYALVKFLFFALPYRMRREILDKAYRGRAAATARTRRDVFAASQ